VGIRFFSKPEPEQALTDYWQGFFFVLPAAFRLSLLANFNLWA
jgi:hypothetical protein